ncbi:MAG: 50S ribosomal protein L20 [Candidatus Omnitrophota bacterium]
MRTKHAVPKKKRRKKILKAAKGYWGDRSKNYRRTIESVRRAWAYSYRDRRAKKREFRSLWIMRINAAAREKGWTYRGLINGLKKNNIILSRDILAQIAAQHPVTFDKIVETAKN